MLVLVYNATSNMIVLGVPLLSNSNITVDYTRGFIGLTGGKDLNPPQINYIPRVIILFVIFGLIAGALASLVYFLNRNERKMETREKNL
jgi:hypothetical protein